MSRNAVKASAEKEGSQLLDELNRSEFEMLGEIDLIRDRCNNLFHVEGKYFVPVLDGPFSTVFRHCLEHMVHPDDRKTYRELMQPETLLERLARAKPTAGVLRAQLRYKLLDGGWRWVEQTVLGGTQHGFGEGMARVYVFDVQNQKDRQQSVATAQSAAGNRDETTGLLQKKPFFTACRELLRSKPGEWGLVSIDIEHFKLFNEWYGHESGDFLLAQIGGILKQEEARSGGLAGYMGQDDFCVLLPLEGKRVEGLYEEIHRLIMSRGTSMGFLPAVGICPVAKGDSIAAALDHASLAASQVKGDFHTRIQIYTPAMSDQTEREYSILSDFQRGLKNHELFFCLQPQCEVTTGRIVGAESLARWRTPDGKMVPPDTFVPVLEKYGFVTDLDEYIWEGVCAWLHRWIRDGHKPVPISVNISQIDFLAIDVPEYLEQLIHKYELPRDTLKIEITESAYVNDSTRIKDAIQRLRDKGFVILMDDFGSGYSSLNMLSRIKVDVIKLDAQFLRMDDLDTKKGIHILETIVNMTKTMAVPVIVEGVENIEQINFLEKLGCRYIQGYFYYKPLQVAEFEELVSDEANIETSGFRFVATQQFSVREFMDRNIYSDSMLNNILGAAAFYCWDGGENVDIVRFNEQFYRVVNVPDFHERLADIKRFIHPSDKEHFFNLLAAAEKDRLNGSSGVLGFYRTDGSLGQFLENFYFLEENEEGKIFYGAMQDVTEITSLQNQMKLLSRFSSESIVFLRKTGNDWAYQVVVHGLRNVMGLSETEFQRELNEGSFHERLGDGEGDELGDIMLDGGLSGSSPGITFRMRRDDEEQIKLYLKMDYVHDTYSNVEYILMFRLREDR